MYTLSCKNCRIEYQFKGLFAKRKLRRFWKECLYCGEKLTVVPLQKYTYSPPPNLKKIDLPEIKKIEVEKGFFRL